MFAKNAVWILSNGESTFYGRVWEDKERWIYITLCLLFQPFIKVALGRVLWNVVDVVVAIGLLISMKSDKK